jgi:uncharacterized metal-binding protein
MRGSNPRHPPCKGGALPTADCHAILADYQGLTTPCPKNSFMPSGQTHDSITLWSLPFIAGTTFALTQSGNLTLLLSGGFLFSGLMFGPDLDIYSQQYRRWGILRWIWLPYRKSMRHRSVLSHGAVIGTIGRVVYLGLWILGFAVLGILVSAIAQSQTDWQSIAQSNFSLLIQLLSTAFQTYWIEGIFLLIGFELGALSHSLSDWIGSAIKRWQKQRRKR